MSSKACGDAAAGEDPARDLVVDTALFNVRSVSPVRRRGTGDERPPA